MLHMQKKLEYGSDKEGSVAVTTEGKKESGPFLGVMLSGRFVVVPLRKRGPAEKRPPRRLSPRILAKLTERKKVG